MRASEGFQKRTAMLPENSLNIDKTKGATKLQKLENILDNNAKSALTNNMISKKKRL